jgi:hypothetical protein
MNLNPGLGIGISGRLAALVVGLSVIVSGAAYAGACDVPQGAHRVYVRDFNAAGDGKTDDGPAIRAALKAALAGPRPASLEFEPGKVYRVKTFDERYVLQLSNADKLTLIGNDAELLLLPPNMVLRVTDSTDVNICGLKVDYAPLPFTQGLVVATDPSAGSFDLAIDPGFDVPVADDGSKASNASVWHFAMPYDSPRSFGRRIHIKTVHAAEGDRRVRIFPTRADEVRRMRPNATHLVMAIPGAGHKGSAIVRVQGSDRVHFEKLRIYSVPKLTFYIANNSGPVTFHDVEQRIRPGTNRVMSGWRGIFHVKDNRAPIELDQCYLEGAFDDAINISAMYQVVSEMTGPNTWRLMGAGQDEIPAYRVGDRVQAIDVAPERKLLGESRIVALNRIGKKEMTVTLADPLPIHTANDVCTRGTQLCGSRLIDLDAANKNSVIRNCTIHGGSRLRSNITVEKSTLDGLTRINADPTRVGPLPSNVLIKDSEISGRIRIGSDRPSGHVEQVRGEDGIVRIVPIRGRGNRPDYVNWDYGERWAKNIVFQNDRINALIKADGASFSLINVELDSSIRRPIRLSNSSVRIDNLTMKGGGIAVLRRLIKIGPNMTNSDVVVDGGSR